MTENLTTVPRHLISDINITQSTNKATIFNDIAIKNISDDVKVVSEIKKTEGTTHNEVSAEINEEFQIPEDIIKFSVTTKNYFYNAQRWIGHIVKINDDESFTAKLEDLKSPTTYEIAEFNIRDVSSDDYEFVNVGNVFYWSVGYNVTNGQVSRASILKMQRLPKLDTAQINRKIKIIDDAVDRADNLLKDINWE